MCKSIIDEKRNGNIFSDWSGAVFETPMRSHEKDELADLIKEADERWEVVSKMEGISGE